MVDTRSGNASRGRGRGGNASRGRGRSRGGRGASQGSVHRSGPAGQHEQPPPELQRFIAETVAKAIHDALHAGAGPPPPPPPPPPPSVHLEDEASGAEGGGPIPVPPKRGSKDFKEFLDCQPPKFRGGSDPTEAMNWITQTEKTFRVSNCIEKNKVEFATSMLRDEAHFWWEMITTTLGPELTGMLSWDQFKVKFMEEYCSDSAIKELEEEFMRLEQGTKSVQEYTVEFNRKGRFAKHQVTPENRKIDRYVWGLRTEVREFVKLSRYTTFRDVVEAAREREREVKRQEASRRIDTKVKKTGGDHKRKWDGKLSENRRSKISRVLNPDKVLIKVKGSIVIDVGESIRENVVVIDVENRDI